MGASFSKDDSGLDCNSPHLRHHHSHDNRKTQQHQQHKQQAKQGHGWSCFSSCAAIDPASDLRMDSSRADAIDPIMYDLCRKSLNMTLHDEKRELELKSKPVLLEEAAPKIEPQLNGYQKNKQHQSFASSNSTTSHVGQHHLLYKNQAKALLTADPFHEETQPNGGVLGAGGGEEISTVPTTSPYNTRLVVRRRPIAAAEEGTHGTHLYAIRYPPDDVGESKKMMAGTTSESSRVQEQCPTSSSSQWGGQKERKKQRNPSAFGLDPSSAPVPEPPKPSPTQQSVPTEGLADFFQPAKMRQSKASKQIIQDWVTVSEEHCIYVVDVGLSPLQCDKIVQVTEQVCRGQYAAYTYAKQTLGCREFPVLAQACAPPVQAVVQAILGLPSNKTRKTNSQNLQLDDREPHLVKYDVTKKERQKLDMHTDKSEWTFLIALSNGCGLDYDGGGTYFECLNATIHVQRGHALIFPGKLRHCGQRITKGLRYLLVGFLVDKSNMVSTSNNSSAAALANTNNAVGAHRNSSDKNQDSNKSSSKTSSDTGTRPVAAMSLTTGSPGQYGTIDT